MAPLEVLPDIPSNVRRLIENHLAFYEVSPHYIALEERSLGAVTSTRRIQGGFDIDIYQIKTSHDSQPSPEYEIVFGLLNDMARTILPNMGERCSIEVISFRSTLIIDTKNHFEPLTMIRITIAHNRGLHQPAGTAEQEASKAIEEQLRGLGLRRA